ncbi:hypothetical protein [Terrisporobacter petrolearius]|uniref:hypothetical protein n=1 Tax=Terrisporobacter petrolearius TaxID=1460447 RepID=UPI0031CC5C36
MDKAKLLPSLRFSGYTDAWERNKLEHYLNVSNEKNTEGIFEKKDVLSVSGDFGIINQIKFHGRSFAGVSIANYGVVNTGDVVYTKSPLKANPFGIIKTNKGPNGIVSTLYAVYHPKENVCPDFIQVYFEQYARMNQYIHPLVNKGAKNDMKVSDANALKGNVVFPKVDEGKNIVEYFSNIDQLILLHQKEYDKFLIMKKAMLEKMFPKKGMNVPEIRFKGFADPWETRRLGDIVERVVRKNTNNESSLPLTISAIDGLVDQTTYFNNRVASRDVSNYYLVINGEFAYNKSTSAGFPFGAVKRLDLYEKGVLSTLYIVFAIKNNEKVNSDFLTVFFDTDRWHRDVAERAAEGARNHGLLNISADDFFDIDLCLPKSEKEQDAIGSYIRNLDHLITLHQHKIEKLKNIKAGCLEKMFV